MGYLNNETIWNKLLVEKDMRLRLALSAYDSKIYLKGEEQAKPQARTFFYFVNLNIQVDMTF